MIGRWMLPLVVLGVVPTLALSARLYEAGPVEQVELSDVESGPSEAELAELLDRARQADRMLEEAEAYYTREVQPLERVLLRYRSDPELVRRISLALVREARRVNLEPRLLLAVLLVENPDLNPTARSWVGARGLMQVMPLHRGNWKACPGDLEAIESNICYGASIFAHYLRSEGGDVERALLRYNGCVRGTNTPNCHAYPSHVYARAGRASILAWLTPMATRGASP